MIIEKPVLTMLFVVMALRIQVNARGITYISVSTVNRTICMSGYNHAGSMAEELIEKVKKKYIIEEHGDSDGKVKLCAKMPSVDAYSRELNKLLKEGKPLPKFDDGYDEECYADQDDYDALQKWDSFSREDELDQRETRREQMKTLWENNKRVFEERGLGEVTEEKKKAAKPKKSAGSGVSGMKNFKDELADSGDSDEDSEDAYHDANFDDDSDSIQPTPRHKTTTRDVREEKQQITLDSLRGIQVKQSELLDWSDSRSFKRDVEELFVRVKINSAESIAQIDGVESIDPYRYHDITYTMGLSVTRLKDRHTETVRLTDVTDEPFTEGDFQIFSEAEILSPKECRDMQKRIGEIREKEMSPDRQRERKCRFALSTKCTSGQVLAEVLREEKHVLERLKAEMARADEPSDRLQEAIEKKEGVIQQLLAKIETLKPATSKSEVTPIKKIDRQDEKLEQRLLRMQNEYKKNQQSQEAEEPNEKLESASAIAHSLSSCFEGLDSSSDDDDGMI